MANIFSRLFKKRAPTNIERAELLTGGTTVFSPFSGNAYENDIYRAAVDAIARNVAKLKGTHVIKAHDGRRGGDPVLDRLLQVRPNPYMSAYDMLYRMTTHYYLYNNAFSILERDMRGYVTAIYPVKPSSVEFVTDQAGRLYCKFLFNTGRELTLPYSDVIHIKRHLNDDDLLGSPNTALLPALELAHTQNEGIIKGIKNGVGLRGILKYAQNLANDLLKKAKDDFITDYMQMENQGGLAALDVKLDYIPLKQEPFNIDEHQIQAAKAKICDYLGISEKIVNATYNEDEWNAFYESIIEPLSLQLSLDFTDKMFTQREQAFGNSILFESNRLQYASAKTKVELIKTLAPMKLLTRNQALDILNLPSVPDGDEYIQSLNYVDASIANQYQLGGSAQREDTATQQGSMVNINDVSDTTEEIAGKQLNGAQTQSLISVMSQYAAKQLTLGQAINIVSIAIGISKQKAKEIIEGLE